MGSRTHAVSGTMVVSERDHISTEERLVLADTQQTRLRGKEITSIHLRLPIALHELLTKSAGENHRSLNAEALVILEKHLYEKYGKQE